jgi:molybdopterin-containing oxidoreductase family iron-sulfur binding subunit
MSVQRREFLKAGLLMAGGAAVGGVGVGRLLAGDAAAAPDGAPATGSLALTTDGRLVVLPPSAGAAPPTGPEEVRRGIAGRRWVMVIDLAACDGCGRCVKACADEHFTPPDREWIRLFKMQDSADAAPYWFPRPCFHCDNPPCTRVCPVGATFKREDGIVLVDNERCIGCRFCMAACPYSARVFNWSRPENPPAALQRGYSPEWGYPRRVGTAEKCDFCPDRVRQGKLPACAAGCEMGVVWFGDENEDAVTNSKDETVRLSELLRNRGGYRYLEELGTKPRVYYLPPVGRRWPAPGEPGAKGGDPQRGAEQR